MYRNASFEDWEAVYELICEMEDTRLPPERFAAIFQSQLRDPCYICLVCECDGHVAGVLNLRFEEQLHHAGRVAEVMEFAVGPAYRSRGIGKGMLAHARRLAEESGCILIEVACNQRRTDAHRFYQSEGMQNSHYKFSSPLTDEALPETLCREAGE